MLVRYVLLTLPIHRRPFATYYEEHDRAMQTRRAELEREWGGQAFDELPAHIRIGFKDRWYWPPWYFNDMIGHLKIGTFDDALLADVFLERRFFPPTAPERFSRQGSEGTFDEREIIYLASVERRPIKPGDNASYLSACRDVIDGANQILREQGHELPQADVWRPGFDLDCFDLAKADRQLRERFPNRVNPR